MRIFLIDFENVHSEGMVGVDHLTERDEVVIFYSSNADSVSFDVLHKLMFCKSKLSYYKIKRGGKNALDFQLSCYLGYRICREPDAEYYIISRDNGFDFIMDFWSCGYVSAEPAIRRFTGIKALIQWEDTQRKQKTAALNAIEELSRGIKDLQQDAEEKTVHKIQGEPEEAETCGNDQQDVKEQEFVLGEDDIEIINSLMSDSKNSHDLYIKTVKRFGQKRGLEIYRNYKSEFVRK